MSGDRDAKRVAGAGQGFSTLFVLFVVFMTLQLSGAINWSWWWITAPLWGPVALAFVVAVVQTVAERSNDSQRRNKLGRF